MYAGSTSISYSHLGYTVSFPKDPKFSQTGEKKKLLLKKIINLLGTLVFPASHKSVKKYAEVT